MLAAFKSKFGRLLAVLLSNISISLAVIFNVSVTVAGPLSSDSPLATSGESVFAVDADGHTLLTRKIHGSNQWVPLSNSLAIGRVGGLFGTRDKLYASDIHSGIIYGIPLRKGDLTRIDLKERIPHPSAIAISAESLFVVDQDTGNIFRVDLNTTERDVSLIQEGSGTDNPVHLAIDEDQLLVSYEGTNRLLRIKNAAQTDPRETMVTNSATESVRRVSSSFRGTPDGDYPPISLPRAITIWKGLLYAISGDGKLYVTPRLFPRTLEVLLATEIRKPVRLLATSEHLLVLDDSQGDLVVLSRQVPTEFVIEREYSECMTALYTYLSDNYVLPTREVAFENTFYQTLRREEALAGGWPEALNNLICKLNNQKCKGTGKGARPKKILQGTAVSIPDLFRETTLAYQRTNLPEDVDIGHFVTESVVSEKFFREREAAVLCKLNPLFKKGAANCDPTILAQKGGQWVLPHEILRYVAVVPATHVKSGQLETSLRMQMGKTGCSGILINPLEQRFASPSNTVQSGTLDASWEEVDEKFKEVLRVVGYPPPPIPGINTPIKIAVAEKIPNVLHLDLRNASGHSSILPPRDPLPDPGALPTFRLRKFINPDDHGTAVLYLMVGQRNRLRSDIPSGLVKRAKIVPLTIELSSIANEFANSNHRQEIKVANLSFSSKLEIDRGSIEQLITQNAQTLFVAAAGNTRDINARVCSGIHQLYPTCLGDHKNLLVVAATNLQGTEIMKRTENILEEPIQEGSFYNNRFVHVASPGEGFYGAGHGEIDYVPLRGTSFSAPFVTATAALLSVQGFGPTEIKRRIIATADPFEANEERLKVLSGRLNIGRAITAPEYTKLRSKPSQSNPDPAETLANLVLDDDREIAFRKEDGEKLEISLARILRIRYLGDEKYWVIYVDEHAEDEPDSRDVVVKTLRIPDGEGIRYQPLLSNGEENGGLVEINLNTLSDFVSPVYAD